MVYKSRERIVADFDVPDVFAPTVWPSKLTASDDDARDLPTARSVLLGGAAFRNGSLLLHASEYAQVD